MKHVLAAALCLAWSMSACADRPRPFPPDSMLTLERPVLTRAEFVTIATTVRDAQAHLASLPDGTPTREFRAALEKFAAVLGTSDPATLAAAADRADETAERVSADSSSAAELHGLHLLLQHVSAVARTRTRRAM